MLVLTRVSAPLGIGVRVDAGCVDVFGIIGVFFHKTPLRIDYVLHFSSFDNVFAGL